MTTTRRRTLAVAALATLPLAAALLQLPSHADDQPPAELSRPFGYLMIGLDGDAWRAELSASATRWTDEAGAVHRVPSTQAETVPEGDEYGWLGAAGDPVWATVAAGDLGDWTTPYAFAVSTRTVRAAQLAPSEPVVRLGIESVTGPGAFSVHAVPATRGETDPPVDVPPEAFRLGTGTQRDGSPQGTGPADVAPGAITYAKARFTAEGMYCVTFTTAATLADGTPAGGSTVVRFAVGDATTPSTPCGSGPGEPSPTPTPTPTPTEPAPTIVRDGHIDAIAPELEGDADGTRGLALRAHSDAGWIDWADLVLYSDDRIRRTLPDEYTDAADYSFAGPPGATVWDSPHGQLPGVPWAGLSTESPTLTELGDGGRVQVRLDAVTGPGGAPAPGDVVIWNDAGTAANAQGILHSTREGLPAGRWVGIGNHQHYHWTFSAPGVYCLAFTVETALPDGTRLADRGQLTQAIGSDVDPAAVQPCERTQEQPPVPAGKPVVDDPGTAPLVVTGGTAALDARLNDGELSVAWRREDAYGAGPGVSSAIDDVILHKEFGATVPGILASHATTQARGVVPSLNWDATGVAADELTWRLVAVDGPGDVSVVQRFPDTTVFDPAAERTEFAVWPGSETAGATWRATAPGRYCLTMEWSARLPGGDVVTDTHVLTAVLDGPLDPDDYERDPETGQFVATGPVFEHDDTTLTRTCAQDGEPIPTPTPTPTPTSSDTPTPTPTPTDGPTTPPDGGDGGTDTGGTGGDETGEGDEAGDDEAGGGGDDGSGDGLPDTGTGPAGPVLLALLALAGGAVLAAAARRAGTPGG